MTMPDERTRAVLYVSEFLRRLASPYNGGIKGVKKEVREEARMLLRHYPLPGDLWCAAIACPLIFDKQPIIDRDGDLDGEDP